MVVARVKRVESFIVSTVHDSEIELNCHLQRRTTDIHPKVKYVQNVNVMWIVSI